MTPSASLTFQVSIFLPSFLIQAFENSGKANLTIQV